MSEARNYQGRVRETYRINIKSDDSSEKIVSAASSSSSDSDTSVVASAASSSRVSEEHESYNLVNSKSLLTNDELLTMLSKDPHFIQNCARYNITESDQALLKNNFTQYIENHTSFTESENDCINQILIQINVAKKRPADNSGWAQFRTTAGAGASAYLSSFMWGKLATNFITSGAVSPHGAWALMFIAGFLNPLVSEPFANAIRLQGAHYGSADGKAYMDFYTALQELRLAKENNQVERINECHTFITKIIDECIEREKLMSRLKSGVEEIQAEDINELTQLCGKSGNIQKVINAAKCRAFVTDELPFLWYSASYAIPGLYSPLIKQSFSPFMAASIDFAVHAVAGTFAGAATGCTQNILRAWLQKSTLQNLSSESKGAQLALVGALRDPWNKKLSNLKDLLEVLELEKVNLQSTLEQDSEDERLEALSELTKDLKQKINYVEKQWKKARAQHGEYDSWLSRTKNAVFASGKSYMGEVSNKDNPGLLEGVPAQANILSKVIAVPLSLSLSCIFTALAIPALLNSDHRNATNVQGLNFTELGDIGIEQPAPLFESTAEISHDANAPYAFVGLFLIVGFITRYLLIHPHLQYWIRPLFGPVGAETDSANNDKNDTVVNVKKSFADSEDESENYEYEGSNYEEPSSSPTTRREINKLNALNMQKTRSNNRNIDGRSSEDSDSFESSRSQSSFV